VSKADKQLRVDFLAPMVGGREAPFEHGELGVNLQPRRFLEFILEDISQAVVLSPVGATVVNVPSPARYALHKMLVFAERRSRNPEKAAKDLAQSAALIEALGPYQADELEHLWKDLHAGGPGWRKRAKTGLKALRRLSSDLEALPMMTRVQDKYA
jgi:hypothetical protein